MHRVSVIITTKNEENNIGSCLDSVKKQLYKHIQMIVVDNNSTDHTKEIAEKYTHLVFNKGPERSAQRNYGVQKASGMYLLFLDADMLLQPKVVEECISKMKENDKIRAVIIPEKSFGKNFWAKAKALERSFYLGNNAIEAARFFSRETFEKFKGFDENITGPEDWDLSQRVAERYKIGRTTFFILHNEDKLSLMKTIKKKYYYAKSFGSYIKKNENMHVIKEQMSLKNRYSLFFSNPRKLFKNPLLGLGMLFMKTCEFVAGGTGYFLGKYKN